MQYDRITEVENIYPCSGGYAHGIIVNNPTRWLLTSGTMGLKKNWEPPKRIEEQLDLCWSNLIHILKEADMEISNIVQLTCYLADREFASANSAVRRKILNGHWVPTTVVVTQLLQPDWLVEMQIIAAV